MHTRNSRTPGTYVSTPLDKKKKRKIIHGRRSSRNATQTLTLTLIGNDLRLEDLTQCYFFVFTITALCRIYWQKLKMDTLKTMSRKMKILFLFNYTFFHDNLDYFDAWDRYALLIGATMLFKTLKDFQNQRCRLKILVQQTPLIILHHKKRERCRNAS